MIKQYSLFCRFTMAVMVLLALGPQAYAQGDSQFNHLVQVIHADRSRIESQLGIDPQSHRLPQATSYYDDKVDHYEQVQIMSDFIDKGIR